MRLAALLLWLGRWRWSVTVPDYPKSIICVAPHTSNWDFVVCKLAYAAVGRRAGFLMKKWWFFWPLGPMFRRMGGVPVAHIPGVSLTSQLIDRFNSSERLNLAITPEGTRARTGRWHTGFLQVAYATGVPVTLAYADFKRREVGMHVTFHPTGDIDADMKAVKSYYKDFTGRHPDQFTIETE